MKSVNTIKLMQDKKNLNNTARKDNTEERLLSDKAKKYVDTYVIPKFKNIDLSNENYKDEVIFQAYSIVLSLSEITLENTPNPIFLTKAEVGFLNSNDVKLKARIGNRIARQVVRINTYDREKEKYIDTYINPILRKLVSENIIVYDKNALDNKMKIANKKIDNLVNKFIDDILKESVNFILFSGIYGEDYISKWDIIFGEDIQTKKDFATMFYNYVKDNYASIDFKNLECIDFAEYTGAKLD